MKRSCVDAEEDELDLSDQEKLDARQHQMSIENARRREEAKRQYDLILKEGYTLDAKQACRTCVRRQTHCVFLFPRPAGKFWEALTAICGITRLMSTPHHPQTDGQSEKTNQTVEVALRHYVDDRQSDWVSHLLMVEFAINTSKNHSSEAAGIMMLDSIETSGEETNSTRNSRYIFHSGQSKLYCGLYSMPRCVIWSLRHLK